MNKRTLFALWATVAWLLLVTALLAIKWKEASTLQLNAIGDFLAGVFSPLAFMWLVVGYFQQGDELQQNTDALRLQADQLKASVQNQTEQLSITKAELQIAEKALELNNQREERLAQPAIRPRVTEMTGGGYGHPADVRVEFKNVGHAATELHFESNQVSIEPSRFLSLDSDRPISLVIKVPSEHLAAFDFSVAYLDGSQNRRITRFRAVRAQSSVYEFQTHGEA